MKEIRDINILAIETSCDETAAAVVHNGRDVLSNIISSQIDLHKLYGGVVPEIASRKHIEKINQVIEEALKEADSPSEQYDANSLLTGSFNGVAEQLGDGSSVSTFREDFEEAQSRLELWQTSYNQQVDDYNAAMDTFPTPLLRWAIFSGSVEKFR